MYFLTLFRLAPFSPLVSSFNMRFREQNIRAPEEKACTAGYIIVNLIKSVPVCDTTLKVTSHQLYGKII